MENIIVIGGGPSGLSAALYAARANLKPLVIEGAPAGGQLTQTSEVENYPGFPEGILGTQLILNFRKQAERFGARIVTDNVKSIKKIKGGLEIDCEDGSIYRAKAIIVGTGSSAKWLGLENEQRLRGKGVSGCATCDAFFFKEKEVVVIGGGDSAMEEASYLSKFASRVTIIHRRDSFKASKIMQERVLANPKIKVIWNTEVIDVLGADKVEGIRLKEGEKSYDFKTDGVFLAIGHTPATKFLEGSDVELDSMGYIITSERVAWEGIKTEKRYDMKYRFATSLPGLFAAGDCVDFVYKQAGTAVGMAIAAELEAEKYLSLIS